MARKNTIETVEETATDVETKRLNRVNDVEKEIIQHQEAVKLLRAELRRLEGKVKRDGPTKIDVCRELYSQNSGLTRKEYVQMFMERAVLSLAAARTYTQIILSKAKKSPAE